MNDHTNTTVHGGGDKLPHTAYFTHDYGQKYTVGYSCEAHGQPQCICIAEQQPGKRGLSIAESRIAVRFSDNYRSLTIIKSNSRIDGAARAPNEATWALVSTALNELIGSCEELTAADIAGMATLPPPRVRPGKKPTTI
jgi:hypothetical protein